MHFRNEIVVATPGLPRGLYWGVYLGDERQGAWKIDVWSTDSAGFEAVREFMEAIAGRLTEANRKTILAIKEAVWRHPEYRRGFTSVDVYGAVLERDVEDVAGFWDDLQRRKGIDRPGA